MTDLLRSESSKLRLGRLWAHTEVNIGLCRDNTLASPTPEKRHWLLYITEERHWDFLCQEIPEAPPHHRGELFGPTPREGPQQVLV